MGQLEKAITIATKMHEGQLRKYSGEPYITHPLRVLEAAKAFGMTEPYLCAAVMHDLLEDTDYSVGQMLYEFGPVVTNVVLDLTNVFTKENCPGSNREQRKTAEFIRLSNINEASKTLKYLDRLDNITDIPRNEGFAKTYLKETLSLINVVVPTDDMYGYTRNVDYTSSKAYYQLYFKCGDLVQYYVDKGEWFD